MPRFFQPPASIKPLHQRHEPCFHLMVSPANPALRSNLRDHTALPHIRLQAPSSHQHSKLLSPDALRMDALPGLWLCNPRAAKHPPFSVALCLSRPSATRYAPPPVLSRVTVTFPFAIISTPLLDSSRCSEPRSRLISQIRRFYGPWPPSISLLSRCFWTFHEGVKSAVGVHLSSFHSFKGRITYNG